MCSQTVTFPAIFLRYGVTISMACLGVHFALTEAQSKKLLSVVSDKSDDDVLAVVEEIEESWDEEFAQETDKAWDAIHRCFSDGTLDLEAGEYPLKMCIFGGRQLCFSGEYYVVYSTPDEVKDVARALKLVTEDWIKERYWALGPDYDEEKNDEDFDYTWENVCGLTDFFEKAARAGRAVIFTVSQ
jgi:hypothetical protein